MQEIETLPVRARKRNADTISQTDYSTDYPEMSHANNRQHDVSEYNAIGIIVAKKLQKMDSTQAIYAESLINSILRRGLLYKLTEDTDVCDGACKTVTETSVNVFTSE